MARSSGLRRKAASYLGFSGAAAVLCRCADSCSRADDPCALLGDSDGTAQSLILHPCGCLACSLRMCHAAASFGPSKLSAFRGVSRQLASTMTPALILSMCFSLLPERARRDYQGGSQHQAPTH